MIVYPSVLVFNLNLPVLPLWKYWVFSSTWWTVWLSAVANEVVRLQLEKLLLMERETMDFCLLLCKLLSVIFQVQHKWKLFLCGFFFFGWLGGWFFFFVYLACQPHECNADTSVLTFIVTSWLMQNMGTIDLKLSLPILVVLAVVKYHIQTSCHCKRCVSSAEHNVWFAVCMMLTISVNMQILRNCHLCMEAFSTNASVSTNVFLPVGFFLHFQSIFSGFHFSWTSKGL